MIESGRRPTSPRGVDTGSFGTKGTASGAPFGKRAFRGRIRPEIRLRRRGSESSNGVGPRRRRFMYYIVPIRKRMPSISARISDDDESELEDVAELLGEDKSTVIRKALNEGLTELRVRLAVERYQNGDLSVNQAAGVAGVSIAEWVEIARERNLTTQLTPSDLEADAAAAREL